MRDIVFIPGHLCDRWLYAPQIAALAGHGRCHLADVTRDDSTGAMADRLLAAFPGPLVLVGLSMGGMVAMEAMARAPERIAGAMLLDTDAYSARPVERAWRDAERAKVAVEGLAGFAERFVAKFFGHSSNAAETLGPMVREHMAHVPPAVFDAQAKALDTRRDMLPRLQGFAAPVEVLAGAADRVCPAKLHPPIAETCADAVFTAIPDCGHLATVEAPEPVNARLEVLMERLAA